MKIAIIRKKYTFHGGAEGFSNSLVEHLADAGNEVHIFAITWNVDTQNNNIYFHRVPAITFISFLRDFTFAVSSFFLLNKQKSDFDIIQSHDKTLCQDIYRAGDGCHIEWLKQRWRHIGFAGKVSILINPYHWLILALERLIFKAHRFRKIIAISEMVRKNIIDNYAVSPSDIEVIYNGVDIGKYHPDNRTKFRNEIRQKHGLPDTAFVALFVGSGFERKGVRYLIEAVNSIPEAVSLMIVGKGGESEFKEMSGRQKIIFCGPQKDVCKYYAAADIFVFPTMYEPFGNVHLEALASGLPVITTKNSGASELIEDNVQGFVVEKPEDTKAISEKIQVFVSDRSKLESMSKNARRLAEEFTFKKHIGKIEKLYETLTTKR